jgi:Domain of unknown function (DUF397)
LPGAVWRKSSHSGQDGNCVEVAANLPAVVAVRDSKDPGGPGLTLGRADWSALTRAIRLHDHGESGRL